MRARPLLMAAGSNQAAGKLPIALHRRYSTPSSSRDGGVE
jgi:hypothetical protein